MGIKRLALSLIIVFMLVLTACSHGTALPLATPPPSTWPTVWTGLSTDPNESGSTDHRDVVAVYYATDSQYLYLRMRTVTAPGWPSTSPTGEARYKWWFDTVGTDLYVSGTLAYKAEFQIVLEDRTNTHNVDGSRDRLGELTLVDDLANIGFTTRWNQGNSGAYITGTPLTGGSSSFWKRTLGSGTAGVGGPQGVMASDIGYRIDNAATGGNFVDMYISWAALGNPSSLCLIWATDNHDPALDQAPNLDRPETTNCLSVCTPPVAAFNATPTSGCGPLTVYFTDQSTGNITGWSWTFGDGGTSTLQNPSHQYASAGSYSVTLNVTTACGWDTETKADYITVYAGPTANAGGDVSFCAGSSVEIGGSPTGSNGTGPYTYSWTPAIGLDNSATANPFASVGGTYTVRVTDANGCWSEDSVIVTQNPTPTANAGIDKSISCGDSVQIGGSPTGSGGTGNYTYSWTPTGGLNDATIANPTASAGGNYTVRVTDDNGCWDEDSVVVTVSNNTLTADAGPDREICPSRSIQIGGSPTASGGTGNYTYSWTPTTGLDNPAIANPSASPSSTTIYSVLVTDSGNCTAIDHVHVTVYDTPSCSVSASPGDHVCQGTTVTLWEHAGDAVTWSWSTGASTQSIQVTSNGTYSVNITDTHGCESSCQISVTVYDGPTANAGADKSFCAGGSVQIGGSPTGGTPPYSYSWTPSVGLNDTTIANPTALAAGNYTVRVTDANGCWDEDSVVVTENANPIAEAGADKVIFPGDSVEIGGSPTGSGGTPPYTYNWTPATGLNATNIANPMASPAVNQTYTVIVTDSNGCTDSDDVTVTVTESCCICGFVYRADTLEPLAGWQVILEKETNSWDVVGTNTTDANGKYCFCGLGAGNYRVSEVVQPGWNQVYPWSPNEYLVTLPEGCCDPESENGSFLNFENQQAGPSTVGWESSPVDKLAVLAPWIALLGVIVVGASLLVLRRRRA